MLFYICYFEAHQLRSYHFSQPKKNGEPEGLATLPGQHKQILSSWSGNLDLRESWCTNIFYTVAQLILLGRTTRYNISTLSHTWGLIINNLTPLLQLWVMNSHRGMHSNLSFGRSRVCQCQMAPGGGLWILGGNSKWVSTCPNI